MKEKKGQEDKTDASPARQKRFASATETQSSRRIQHSGRVGGRAQHQGGILCESGRRWRAAIRLQRSSATANGFLLGTENLGRDSQPTAMLKYHHMRLQVTVRHPRVCNSHHVKGQSQLASHHKTNNTIGLTAVSAETSSCPIWSAPQHWKYFAYMGNSLSCSRTACATRHKCLMSSKPIACLSQSISMHT